ncbi:hypothetical protein ANABIO32_37880 [Rossellomorea marisflavi]|uniref:hypothetical protein n=1 Tax=Rossellomorea marisflavi TaxID=189381 RepID=UPI0025C850BC|nr:hypothetical protein [Rossellomorea marisflavi]GLI86019.1 hypothetical protein ANABIO32_37880 [Rossellomorea marisflavi]
MYLIQQLDTLQSSKSAMKRRRLTPAWIRGKVETLEAPAEAAQMPPRRKAAAAAKWNGLLTKKYVS